MPLLLLLLVLRSAPGAPQAGAAQAEAERLFALGQRLFAEGDAAGAVAAFEGAAATGWTAGALDYDWGTACLATADLGCAVLHLERAARALPSHEAVAHNLRLARERAGAVDEPASPLTAIRRALGTGVLLGLGLALYVAVVALLGYRLWTRRSAPWLRRTILLLAPLAAAVLGLGVWAWADARNPEAVVVAPAVLHAAPGVDGGATLPPGRLVRLLARRGDWAEIHVDGERGWLPARAVEEI